MTRSTPQKAVLVFLMASGALLSAHADGNKNKGPMVIPLAKYQQECSACHIAYPAGMLPAASWSHLMGNLSKHYGTDASLDAASVRELTGWLNVHAGTYKRVSEAPPQDRITKSNWFLRKHRDGEVPVGVWARASVGSASNCVACHSGAAQGNFNEHDVRIPK